MKNRTVKKVQRRARKLTRQARSAVASLTPAARRRARQKRERRAQARQFLVTTGKIAANEAVVLWRERRAAKRGRQVGKAEAKAEQD